MIARNIDVVTESASQPAIDVTNMMIVVTTATSKNVVCTTKILVTSIRFDFKVKEIINFIF